jgi:hypothetical protein
LSFPLEPGDPLQPSNTLEEGATAVPVDRRRADAGANDLRARMPRWASQDVRRVERRRVQRDLGGSTAGCSDAMIAEGN